MSAKHAKPAGMSRTAAAIAWIENGADEGGEPRRTAYRAAQLFGISQPAISQELSRRRMKRPMFAAVVISAQAADPRTPPARPAADPTETPGITFREIPAEP